MLLDQGFATVVGQGRRGGGVGNAHVHHAAHACATCGVDQPAARSSTARSQWRAGGRPQIGFAQVLEHDGCVGARTGQPRDGSHLLQPHANIADEAQLPEHPGSAQVVGPAAECRVRLNLARPANPADAGQGAEPVQLAAHAGALELGARDDAAEPLRVGLTSDQARLGGALDEVVREPPGAEAGLHGRCARDRAVYLP